MDVGLNRPAQVEPGALVGRTSARYPCNLSDLLVAIAMSTRFLSGPAWLTYGWGTLYSCTLSNVIETSSNVKHI
jgi:hypothetical protein